MASPPDVKGSEHFPPWLQEADVNVSHSRRRLLALSGGAIASGVLGRPAAGVNRRDYEVESAASSGPDHPNVVLVMTDDQGYGDVGVYPGSSGVETPNIDAMAADGAMFSQFYAAAPFCTPTRISLLTGKYPHRFDVPNNGLIFPKTDDGLPPSEVTIAELLKSRGYATACIGKWHVGHEAEYLPTNQGFDYYYGLPYSNDMTPLSLYRNTTVIEHPVDQQTLTRRYTQEARRFVEANVDHPFFLYLPHTMPHDPLHVSEEFDGATGNGLYSDVIRELDWSVGQLRAALETHDLAENTLLVFISDNGPQRNQGGSTGPLRGWKGTVWEGGLRVPAVAEWPGRIRPGTVVDEMATTMDFYPTVRALTGAPRSGNAWTVEWPKPKPTDGQNLLPLLEDDPTESSYDYFQYFPPWNEPDSRAIRDATGWKYHEKRGELYNLEIDPGEQNDIAEEFPRVRSRLESRLSTLHS